MHPDDYDDDRFAIRSENIAQEIRESDRQMKQILADVTCNLPDAMYDDISDALIKLNGTHPDSLPGSAVLASLYRYGGCISALVDAEVKRLAENQAERESESWPRWQGTMEATQRHTQQTGDPDDY